MKEIVRILKPGGRALITVWAKEQEIANKKSTYISKPSKTNPKDVCPIHGAETPNDEEIAVHQPRTEFQRADCLVPWTKPTEKLLRYYHVFVKNELEHILTRIKDVRIVETYNDDGNWCVVFMKIV